MDGTLTLIFAISKTTRDSKNLIKKHSNIFKSYVKFQSLKDLANKLSVSNPFVFWTQNDHNSLNFGATKKLKTHFFTKK